MKSFISYAIKVVITLGLLFAIFHKIGAASIITQFRKLPVGSVLLCVILAFLQQWVVASRFSRVVELCGGYLSPRRSLRLCIESMFFSQAFISLLGGDIFRAWRLRSSGLLPVDIARAVIFDRLNALFLNHLLLALAVLPVLPLISDRKIALGIVIIALGGLVGLAALVVVGMAIDRVRDLGPVQRMTERSRACSRVGYRRRWAVLRQGAAQHRNIAVQPDWRAHQLRSDIAASHWNGPDASVQAAGSTKLSDDDAAYRCAHVMIRDLRRGAIMIPE